MTLTIRETYYNDGYPKGDNVTLVYECDKNEYKVDESWESWSAEIYHDFSHSERIYTWIYNNPFPDEATIQDIFNCYKISHLLDEFEAEYLWLIIN